MYTFACLVVCALVLALWTAANDVASRLEDKKSVDLTGALVRLVVGLTTWALLLFVGSAMFNQAVELDAQTAVAQKVHTP